MTQIKPFKGVYFNSEKVGDLSQVVCPPYDVISTEEQNEFHNKHPQNFIRVLLGIEKSRDNRYDNKYTRARKTFDDWLRKGILKEDNKSCIYFYRQEFMIRGEKHFRLGFISLMRLFDKNESKVLPHENTHFSAKEDRIRLWRNVKANLSSIFVGFSDKDKKVEKIFQSHVSTQEPFIDIKDQENTRHTMWRLEDTKLINEIKDTLDGQHLFIADGHHRYEVAQELKRTMLAKKKRVNGQEACNFIMTYFTNIDARNLCIFPIHRVIKKLKHKLDFLGDNFRITPQTNAIFLG